MKKYQFFILFIVYINIICCQELENTHLKIKDTNNTIAGIGLYKIFTLKDSENARAPFILHPKGDRVYYIGKQSENKNSIIIYEINLKDHSHKMYFDPFSYFEKEKQGYVVIWNIAFIDKNKMLCSATDVYSKKEAGEIDLDKLFTINTETNEIKYEVISNTDLSSDAYYHFRNIFHRNRFENNKLLLFDYSTFKKVEYSIPNEFSKSIDKVFSFGVGRNIDEMMLFYEQKNIGNDITKKYKLLFYDKITNKVINEYDIPRLAFNNPEYIFFSGRASLLPGLSETIIIDSRVNGLWIYYLKETKLKNLIWWDSREWEYQPYIYLWDVSWNSSKLLLSNGRSLYILDINEYLENHPKGEPPTVFGMP